MPREDLLDQFAHEAPAIAVGERDVAVLDHRCRSPRLSEMQGLDQLAEGKPAVIGGNRRGQEDRQCPAPDQQR